MGDQQYQELEIQNADHNAKPDAPPKPVESSAPSNDESGNLVSKPTRENQGNASKQSNMQKPSEQQPVPQADPQSFAVHRNEGIESEPQKRSTLELVPPVSFGIVMACLVCCLFALLPALMFYDYYNEICDSEKHSPEDVSKCVSKELWRWVNFRTGVAGLGFAIIALIALAIRCAVCSSSCAKRFLWIGVIVDGVLLGLIFLAVLLITVGFALKPAYYNQQSDNYDARVDGFRSMVLPAKIIIWFAFFSMIPGVVAEVIIAIKKSSPQKGAVLKAPAQKESNLESAANA